MADGEYNIAGIPLAGVEGYVGNLIMTNTRYQFAMTQLRALHKSDGGYSCKCGKPMSGCPSRAVIVAFDALEKEQAR